jgi:diketogulonate reductase-like aldo/keto reductase
VHSTISRTATDDGSLAHDGITYVPFFPLGGFAQSTTVSNAAKGLVATPMQVTLAWLLQRAPNILLIPGTSSVGHLRETLAATDLKLPSEAVTVLDRIATGAETFPQSAFTVKPTFVGMT